MRDGNVLGGSAQALSSALLCCLSIDNDGPLLLKF